MERSNYEPFRGDCSVFGLYLQVAVALGTKRIQTNQVDSVYAHPLLGLMVFSDLR